MGRWRHRRNRCRSRRRGSRRLGDRRLDRRRLGGQRLFRHDRLLARCALLLGLFLFDSFDELGNDHGRRRRSDDRLFLWRLSPDAWGGLDDGARRFDGLLLLFNQRLVFADDDGSGTRGKLLACKNCSDHFGLERL